MYPLAHVGVPTAIAFFGLRDRLRVDYRALWVGALLPDAVDKGVLFPLGLAGSKGAGHTLLAAFAAAALAVALAGAWRIAAASLSAGILSHLLLDAPWMDLRLWLWPAFGFGFPEYAFEPGDNPGRLIRDPVLVVGESIGLLLLALVAWRARLHRRREAAALTRTGSLSGRGL
ncbi:MAG: metal-dependent hydrolase [Methanobacteriota archaeon]